MWRGLLGLCSIVYVLGSAIPAFAQAPTVELSFTPVDRAQIAVWVEREDGTFMGTLALTYAVGKQGIGNRPGALQMNSGYRWPYGRREGVLPVWAHRRAAAPGARQFKRVIFQDRTSEGYASRTSDDMSPDNYFCLSFQRETSGREALDAITCASVFSSDKGRYVNENDVARGYAEPYEDRPGVGRMRPLGLTSLYPPRRDVDRCTQQGCKDHADVADFKKHALTVMPELEAITSATLQGDSAASWTFRLPAEWPKTERYKLFMEVNVEGDYNSAYDDKGYPTPRTPMSSWDSWSLQYGYAYRGQPSVVYSMPFTLTASNTSSVLEPIGFGALHGEDGSISPMTKSISNDPSARRGSGADRLLAVNNSRLTLRVHVPDAAYCQITPKAPAVVDLKVAPDKNKSFSHMWAKLSFRTPLSERPISAYTVEVKAENADWEPAFTPDERQVLLPVALDLCADPNQAGVNRCEGLPAGSEITATIAGLMQSTRYEVRVTPRDRMCGEPGASSVAPLTTPQRTFSTVTPCFVASAAYGSPLASEISILRAFRDRHLANHQWGRSLVALYYAVGPDLARPVAEHAWLRELARAILWPVVKLANWWMK